MRTLAVIGMIVGAPGDGAGVPRPEAPEFPRAWFGRWRGAAEVHRPGSGRAMEFVMELHVGPELPREADAEGQAPGPRRWKWTIIYDGPQGRQERAYELVERDAAKGLYAIDEKNSIVLPASLIGGALVSAFEVGGTMLVSSDRFDAAGPGPEDDSIVVEIVSFPAGKAESTGQQGDVPEVKGYTPISIQRAVLTRG